MKRQSSLFSKTLIGWYLYDAGASAFATSVITVFFGPHITQVAKAAADIEGYVYPFGIQIFAGAIFPFIISVSVVLQIVLLPLLGAMADYSQRKLSLLAGAAFGGVTCVAAMWCAGDQSYMLDATLFILANVAFGAAAVLYNSFLPELCTPEQRNAVSSTGWGLSYLSGGLLLLMQYLFLRFMEPMGVSEYDASRYCLLSSALWWGAFTVATLFQLRVEKRPVRRHAVRAGMPQLLSTIRHLRGSPHTLLFLIAFLAYSDGIQTVTSVSTQFGQEEIGLHVEQLAEVILIVQFVGFFGAVLFNGIAKVLGNKRTIMTALGFYVLITLYAAGPLSTAAEFYVMAACIALVLVGSQAISRSAFSQMIPRGREAEYFGIYEISERGTSWFGPMLFGLALQFSGSYRMAVLALGLFFLAGLILLARVNFAGAEAESRNGGSIQHAESTPMTHHPIGTLPPASK